MKHLAADTATDAARQPQAHANGRPVHRFGHGPASLSSAGLMQKSWCGPANLLEMLHAGFHYSVICGHATLALACGFVVCHHFDDELPVLKSRGLMSRTVTADAKARAVYKTALKTDQGRLRFRTDERKNNADDCVAVIRIPVDFPVTHAGMMSMRENIHATYPPSAAVAPILHRLTLATLARRGITLSTGAAE